MKLKFKKRYIVIALIILLVVWIGISMSKGPALMQVETTAVERADIESIVSAAGTVNANTTKEVYVTSAAKVQKLYVEKNDVVAAGQKIVDLDLDDLNTNLRQLKINKEIQELNYQKLSLTNETGSLSLIQTENLADTAKQNYENSLALYELGAISKLELDTAEKAYKEASAGLSLATVSNGADTEILKRQIEISQIQIDTLAKEISKMKESMLSPISGVIGELNMIEGSYTSAVGPIYKVIDTTEFEITANVKEFIAKNIKAGQKVYITGDAFDGITYEGYIKSISPVATKSASTTGSQTFIEVIVGVNTEETLLTDGLNVTCDIVVAQKDSALSIPLSAFMEDKDGNRYVYTLENSTLKKIFIETGLNSEDRLEVMSGLEEGGIVVDDIGTAHKDGAKVMLKV